MEGRWSPVLYVVQLRKATLLSNDGVGHKLRLAASTLIPQELKTLHKRVDPLAVRLQVGEHSRNWLAVKVYVKASADRRRHC